MTDKIEIVGDLQRLELRPGDALVLHSNLRLSDEVAKRLAHYVERKFPGHACIVIDSGFTLSVMSKEAAEA